MEEVVVKIAPSLSSVINFAKSTSSEDTAKKSVNCPGRKIENQMPVHIVASPLSDRNPIAFSSVKRPKESALYHNQRASYKEVKKIELNPSSSKKSAREDKKQGRAELCLTDKKAAKKFSPVKTQKRQAAKYPRSTSNSQFVDELKGILDAKKKADIPFSTNRFQGKYKEVVPQVFKKAFKEHNKQIQEQKEKKIQVKQKSDGAKSDSAKAQAGSKIILKRRKPVKAPLEKVVCKTRKWDHKSRVKEMGLEFILKTSPEKLSKFSHKP